MSIVYSTVQYSTSLVADLDTVPFSLFQFTILPVCTKIFSTFGITATFPSMSAEVKCGKIDHAHFRKDNKYSKLHRDSVEVGQH